MDKTTDMFSAISNAVKDAMKSGNALKRDCLRSVLAEIKNETVNAGKSISDEVCMKVLKKAVKSHNDSISQFKDAGRIDLLEKEETELKVLEEFLPKMLSEEAVQTIVLKVIADNKIEEVKKSFGQVMKLLNSHPESSQIDRKYVSQYLMGILK